MTWRPESKNVWWWYLFLVEVELSNLSRNVNEHLSRSERHDNSRWFMLIGWPNVVTTSFWWRVAQSRPTTPQSPQPWGSEPTHGVFSLDGASEPLHNGHEVYVEEQRLEEARGRIGQRVRIRRRLVEEAARTRRTCQHHRCCCRQNAIYDSSYDLKFWQTKLMSFSIAFLIQLW